MIIATLLLLQIPQPMPAASLPPADSPDWRLFIGAPLVWERDRFGSRESVREALDFNWRHQLWIESELEYELDSRRRSILCNWSRENQEQRRVWYLLIWTWYYTDPWAIRVQLAKLRDEIGEEAFARGQMPPCVPVWRFRALKPLRTILD